MPERFVPRQPAPYAGAGATDDTHGTVDPWRDREGDHDEAVNAAAGRTRLHDEAEALHDEAAELLAAAEQLAMVTEVAAHPRTDDVAALTDPTH